MRPKRQPQDQPAAPSPRAPYAPGPLPLDDFDAEDAASIQAILDQLAARRATEAHGALFGALGAAQHELEITKGKLATVTGELADTSAELAAARRELDRIARAAMPVDATPAEPERVACSRCHAVLAIVGRDPIPSACHACGLKVPG